MSNKLLEKIRNAI